MMLPINVTSQWITMGPNVSSRYDEMDRSILDHLSHGTCNNVCTCNFVALLEMCFFHHGNSFRLTGKWFEPLAIFRRLKRNIFVLPINTCVPLKLVLCHCSYICSRQLTRGGGYNLSHVLYLPPLTSKIKS
jgi:hypothetical protein